MEKKSAGLTLPSLFRKTSFLLILFGLSISPAIAACHTVSPTGSGAKTGADWNNAYAGLPSTLTRGDIYYLADGTYGSLSLKTADSGTTVIELRKAQSYDNCTSTGWNTSTMGSSQAIFDWTSGPFVSITSDYWKINGNGTNVGTTNVGCGGVFANPPTWSSNTSQQAGPPTPSDCGIKIDALPCTTSGVTSNNGCDGGNGEMHTSGNNIDWDSVEWRGAGLNNDGNNNSETYFWFSGSNSSNMVVEHCYCHNAATTFITNASGSWNNAVIAYNYFWSVFDGSLNHGEALQDTGSDSGTVIHHNIFRDMTTNGDLVFVDPVTGTHDSFAFYNNVDVCSSGNTCRHNDGFIACINSSQTCTNMSVYQNTFIGVGTNSGIVFTNAGTGKAYNNLFYNSASADLTALTQDYNSFLNTSGSSGAHDIDISSAASDPFVNWSGGNFNLASDNSDWNNRISLSSPYNVDMNGNAFTTDRGAYQFVNATLASPNSLNGSVNPR